MVSPVRSRNLRDSARRDVDDVVLAREVAELWGAEEAEASPSSASRAPPRRRAAPAAWPGSPGLENQVVAVLLVDLRFRDADHLGDLEDVLGLPLLELDEPVLAIFGPAFGPAFGTLLGSFGSFGSFASLVMVHLFSMGSGGFLGRFALPPSAPVSGAFAIFLRLRGPPSGPRSLSAWAAIPGSGQA